MGKGFWRGDKNALKLDVVMGVHLREHPKNR